MRCTACGSDNAYVGIYNVECVNKKCKHYSSKWVEDFSSRVVKPAFSVSNLKIKIVDTAKKVFTFDRTKKQGFLSERRCDGRVFTEDEIDNIPLNTWREMARWARDNGCTEFETIYTDDPTLVGSIEEDYDKRAIFPLSEWIQRVERAYGKLGS